MVVEILSPNDETSNKLPFYADHRVDELIVVDPLTRSIDWRALERERYVPVDQSALIDLGGERLTQRLDWPPADE